MENLYSLFQEFMDADRILLEEPMEKHTTFRIGGPADYVLQPASAEEVRKAVDVCRRHRIPWFIMGNGSNLLVSDQGYRGAVIQLYRNMSQADVDGCRIKAQAGTSLAGLSKKAMEASLTGLEFAGGIPGTLGGAVTMNAGAYGGEMKDVLESVTALESSGQVISLRADQLEMGYRDSVVKRRQCIVLEAVMRLRPGDKEAIRESMQDLAQKRISKQPLEYPSAGSAFKRPKGHFAGKLIMDAGLKGCRVGDAQVAEKHCGFVINRGHATAADVAALMKHVQDEVMRQFQVKLEPEVKFLGDFPDTLL